VRISRRKSTGGQTLRRAIPLGLVLALAWMGAGCSTIRPRHAVPANKQSRTEIPGLPGVRAWGDEFSPVFQQSLVQAFAAALASSPSAAVETWDLLAISGGAGDGAYGAGLLCGWTQAGNRPKFRLVTGISTGALMAPFAFLGPEYDEELSALYTNITSRNIFTFGFLDPLRMFYRDYVANTRPLRNLAQKHYNREMIEKIAVEHRQGRRLYVGTTCLDAQRPVIWDLGAIAASQHPNKVRLFQEIVLASAAIPVLFPPVYLEVEADGETYDEMHVDGGVIAQVFICGSVLDPADAWREARGGGGAPRLRFFVIRNNHLSPDWQEVRPRITAIAKRALGTLTKAGGAADVDRIADYARQHNADFNLAFIPFWKSLDRKEEFDRKFMTELYHDGFQAAKDGYPWQKDFSYLSPPDADKPEP